MNSNNCHPALLSLDYPGGELPLEESHMVPMREPGPARALAASEIDWSQVEVLLPSPKTAAPTIDVTGV